MWYFSFKISYCTYSYSMVDRKLKLKKRGEYCYLKYALWDVAQVLGHMLCLLRP